MAQLILNTFTAYEQSEEEQLIGMSLCSEQKQFIQTQIARIAEERIAIAPEPNNYAAFIQQEAYLKGQLEFAKYLLDCAAEVESHRFTEQDSQQ